MSEMLGNQYFMARNYTQAMREFEEVVSKYPANLSIKKKLVVCYTQAGKVDRALKIFNELILEDIDFVANTHPEDDDCPCHELVKIIEKESDNNLLSADFNLILGMIWFYCDISKSIFYFSKSLEYRQNDASISSILDLITEYKIKVESTEQK